MDKPFSEACERNKAPILEQLRGLYAQVGTVLEIGSGSGQHALHFAAQMPHLVWQCSEVAAHLPGLRLWLDEAGLPNLPPPCELDVGRPWPPGRYHAVYTANTLHIMGWAQVQDLFAALPSALRPGGLFTAYGPFHRSGRFNSDSNRRFDAALRAADPVRGLRDVEAVDGLACAAGLQPLADVAMPANNLLLTWRLQGRRGLR
jgi:cyclopropane fatty-acyl-phospholipid synthase-like methyltransferase